MPTAERSPQRSQSASRKTAKSHHLVSRSHLRNRDRVQVQRRLIADTNRYRMDMAAERRQARGIAIVRRVPAFERDRLVAPRWQVCCSVAARTITAQRDDRLGIHTSRNQIHPACSGTAVQVHRALQTPRLIAYHYAYRRARSSWDDNKLMLQQVSIAIARRFDIPNP